MSVYLPLVKVWITTISESFFLLTNVKTVMFLYFFVVFLQNSGGKTDVFKHYSISLVQNMVIADILNTHEMKMWVVWAFLGLLRWVPVKLGRREIRSIFNIMLQTSTAPGELTINSKPIQGQTFFIYWKFCRWFSFKLNITFSKCCDNTFITLGM